MSAALARSQSFHTFNTPQTAANKNGNNVSQSGRVSILGLQVVQIPSFSFPFDFPLTCHSTASHQILCYFHELICILQPLLVISKLFNICKNILVKQVNMQFKAPQKLTLEYYCLCFAVLMYYTENTIRQQSVICSILCFFYIVSCDNK